MKGLKDMLLCEQRRLEDILEKTEKTFLLIRFCPGPYHGVGFSSLAGEYVLKLQGLVYIPLYLQPAKHNCCHRVAFA